MKSRLNILITGILLSISVMVPCKGQVDAGKNPYPGWKYSGVMNILTTPGGADLPVSASVKDFPLLVRLDHEVFNFKECGSAGEDIRFATAAGMPLKYQIEEWDAVRGKAIIWVRIPEINGNSRQEFKIYWGKAGAVCESDGSAVFNESNGYVAALHMADPIRDATDSLKPENSGTTETNGIVGPARHFEEGRGITCGENILAFPVGSQPSTTQAWVRADLPNGLVVGWGNEEKVGKVIMHFASPPKIRIDCYWSGANVSGNTKLGLSEWVHMVHTCQEGDSRVYINGRLDGFSSEVKNPLALKSPAGMWIGGWKDEYWFSGDVDEVRISKVARSADWIKLEYENQKPIQTLVGTLVQSGDDFSVSVRMAEVPEEKSFNVTATAGGAIKVYWIRAEKGSEEILATNRFSYTFHAGRVVSEQHPLLQFKAIYPDTVKIVNIQIRVMETIPEPIFELKSPDTWNGRDEIEVVPAIANGKEMTESGAGRLNYHWNIKGGAVIKRVDPGKLILLRSQYSGKITVGLEMNNGGANSFSSREITITEPRKDPWVQGIPAPGEKPVDNQFYARNDQNVGLLCYNGALPGRYDSVFLRIYADDKLFSRQAMALPKDGTYRFTSHLKPGLIRYKVEFGSVKRGAEKVLDVASNIVCGDVYIIDGQSNAEANDYGRAVNPYGSDFLRSFGSASTEPEKCRMNRWGNAVSFDNEGARFQIGYWGIELGKQLIEEQKMPVCIINGSVGGSRIDVHQRNESNPTDSTTIYGRLLWRIQQAGLTHGIRGVFWHQGENDQGAAGPTGRFGWEDYRQYFIDMAAAWKQDYPNIQHYYIFQIWPRSCAMTENGSDNVLREVQRTLPRYFSNLSVMSTLGIKPPGGCHYPPEGYAQIAHLIAPLVERDNYGEIFDHPITAPDLMKACFSNQQRDEIMLQFDQPVVWNDSLISQFYPDGESGRVLSGTATGNTIWLRLKPGADPLTLTYLDSKKWSQDNLLWGRNGIAALTFWEVGIEPWVEEVHAKRVPIALVDPSSEAGAVMTVYRPEKPNGKVVVICPGGGYGMLVTGPEGSGIAQWLNQNGITGVVLEYRLPHGRPEVPLHDAQRAIRLIRYHAADLGIDIHHVGIIGFSAGGHLASTAATHFDGGDPLAMDPVDRLSCRPDFAILIYPVVTMGLKTHRGSKTNLLGQSPDPEMIAYYSNELQVTDSTPPTFLAHAQDDMVVDPINSLLFYQALKKHHVAAEYIQLPSGDHGLNGYQGPMWEEWQTKALLWLTTINTQSK